MVLLGIFLTKEGNLSQNKIEILDSSSGQNGGEIVVEIAGKVINPAVYKLPNGSRIKDLLVAAGGILDGVERIWMEKTLNRATKLSDGQKIYFLVTDKQSNILSAKNNGDDKTISSNFSSQGSGLTNINYSTQKNLILYQELALFTAKTSLNTVLTQQLKNYCPKRLFPHQPLKK